VVETEKHPVVLARREGPAEWPHVLIYGHYDVQPPDPLGLWETPAFEPREKGGRLYGRGTADNKGPLMVHVAAAARLLEENPNLPLRLTFLIEGEEEIGSPSLPMVLEERKEQLRGDFILLSDTLNPSLDQVAVTTAIRGMACLEAILEGPRGDLHSGMFGGAIYNPVQALTELCASLHDKEGRVAIPGFYDNIRPPADWEKEQIAALPTSDADLVAFAGVPATRPVPGRTAMEAVRFEPTLEFNGIYGGYMGEGEKTIIPSRAGVKISCRLVADQDPARIEELLESTLRERCPPEVRLDIRMGHSGPPYSVVPPDRSNTPVDQNAHLAAAFRATDAAVTEVFGKAPLYLREGGSIPIIGEMHRILGMDSLMLGMGTAENNLHAPNESVHLPTLEKGIAVSMRILKAVAGG
jgi:acetylornithine deacetylase/succinyl-diaminopimelate desuccinylase-like protein